jgi:hypothetical protein
MTSRQPSFYLQALAIATTAVILLVVALPRLLAQAPLAAGMIPAGKEPEAVTADAAGRAISAAEWASALHAGSRDNHRALADMLLVRFQQQVDARNLEEALPTLHLAEQALIAGLSQAPAAPDMWLSLARLRSLSAPPDIQAMRYMANSYLTGPRESWMSPQRLPFALSHWDRLTPAIQDAVRRELRDQTAEGLARLALGRSPLVVDMIKEEIATRPEPVRKDFERARRRIDKGVL